LACLPPCPPARLPAPNLQPAYLTVHLDAARKVQIRSAEQNWQVGSSLQTTSIFVRSSFNSKHVVWLLLFVSYFALLTNATIKEPLEKKK
jgi:hypothetical protein